MPEETTPRRTISQHARQRLTERDIPANIIADVLESGNKRIFVQRGTAEYFKRYDGVEYVVVLGLKSNEIVTVWKTVRKRRIAKIKRGNHA